MRGIRRPLMGRGVATILFLAAIGIATRAGALTLTRGPYLGRTDDESVIVLWRTDVPADGEVNYAPEGQPRITIRQEMAVVDHRIRLTGLQSGAVYTYTIWSSGIVLASGTLTAPPQADERFVFGVIGDTDCRNANRGAQLDCAIPTAISRSLASVHPDFVLHTGDVVYPSGSAADYDAKFFHPFETLLRCAPIFPTLGNHDVATAKGQPLLTNFALPTNDEGNSRYYAVRHGSALLICLDVETSPYGFGSKQYRWLQAQLGNPRATWIFLWFHEPAYSSAQTNNIVRLVLSPLFEYYKVDVVFSGHEHLYERTVPIREFVASGPGVVYMTIGGGGATPTSFQREDYSAFAAGDFSYVTVAIDGARATLEAHDPNGKTFDSVVLLKEVSSRAGRRRSAGSGR